jgi:hypothetical protein
MDASDALSIQFGEVARAHALHGCGIQSMRRLRKIVPTTNAQASSAFSGTDNETVSTRTSSSPNDLS